jgi:SAM-dependent methyltransferase
MASEFDPRTYWERRLDERFSLDGVGWIGLGRAFNRSMYGVRRSVFIRTLRRLVGRPQDLRVLDVGSGTGFYVDCWHDLGVRAVTGADITETAVERLRKRYPGDRFERFDLGAAELPFPEGSFDAISCMDVLFHIVDDERFEQAFGNVFSLLAPNGVFVFSDNFLHGPAIRGENQVSRSIETIESAVTAAGFEIVERRPMFVLFNTPVDTRNRLLHGWWRLLSNAASRWNVVGAVLGTVVYPVELALVSRLGEGPSTELMVCRRPATPAAAVGAAVARDHST